MIVNRNSIAKMRVARFSDFALALDPDFRGKYEGFVLSQLALLEAQGSKVRTAQFPENTTDERRPSIHGSYTLLSE
jgi:hypothetical protein